LFLVLLIYWGIRAKWRKQFLILASYIFYCSWKWQYGFLLLGLGVFNWAYGRWVIKKSGKRKYLWPGIVVNVSILVIFKYTNFIVQNMSFMNVRLGGNSFSIPNILLPLGISFFTFQGVAYLVDVASGERPFIKLTDYLLFKAFWPQLIAGPIIRPREIHDQIENERKWSNENIEYGLKRILSGFFKKIVLADNLAPVVDVVFLKNASPGFIDMAAGVIGFGLQIYFDFSAYSDIAIGSARLFGYRFPENFNWPYLATSPREFWGRWHMTLSRWIKDYLFTPLAVSFRGAKAYMLLAVMISMGICGLWHGAAWTFIIWGLWHGVLLISGELLFPQNKKRRPIISNLSKYGGWVFTMVGVFIGWLIFRAESIGAVQRIFKSVSMAPLLKPQLLRENQLILVATIFLFTFFVNLIKTLDWQAKMRSSNLWLEVRPLVMPLIYAVVIAIIIIADTGSKAFVYFQF
jgi:alginate O-acetyltransferase complex protein AlgI